MAIRMTSLADYPLLLDLQIESIRSLSDTYTAEEIETWVDYLTKEGADRYSPYHNWAYVDTDDSSVALSRCRTIRKSVLPLLNASM